MITDLYDASYFGMRESMGDLRVRAYAQEYARVIQYVNGGNVLDIGCGEGGFLECFQGERWTRYGLEVSEYAKRKAQLKGICMMNYHELPNNSFDLVVFRGVLQHIDEPFYSLRRAYGYLRPGGILAILAQPDADSLCYKLFGELPALDPPRNWWIPGAKEIKNILINLGFHSIDIIRPYWGGPYADPLHDFLCFIGRLFGIHKPFAFPGNMIEVMATK